MSFLRMSSVGHLPPDQKLKRGEVLLQYTRVLQPPDYTPIPLNQQQVHTTHTQHTRHATARAKACDRG